MRTAQIRPMSNAIRILRGAGLLAACLSLALLAACRRAAPPPPPQPPNIVFILVDDLGWGDVGYLGSEIETPNIDALAAAGIRLNQFYVLPVCTPTRAALLTGRYPIRYGLQVGIMRTTKNFGLPSDEHTIAEALRPAGYATAIVGKWHLGTRDEELPLHQGFDRHYGCYYGSLNYFTRVRGGMVEWYRDGAPVHDAGYTTDLIAAEAERIIAAHDRWRPLFLYIPFTAPHTPLQAPPEFLARYQHIADQNRRIYAAMVSSLDAAVGRIVASLETHGLSDNTLLVFCSDNGPDYAGNAGPLRGAKRSLYEGGVRVPAIAVWPGKIAAGSRTDAVCHVVDWYPTLLGLAGRNEPPTRPIDGRDIWPVLAHGAESPHDELLLNIIPDRAALRRGSWKLLATYDGDEPQYELYDLAVDPFEKDNLAAAQPALVSELAGRIDFYAAQAVKPRLPDRKPDVRRTHEGPD